MTDKKISELTSITGADVSDAEDVLPIVDTSETTTKKITRAELFKSVSSVDINGGGTFSGNVGIGTSSPLARLHIASGSDEPLSWGATNAAWNYAVVRHHSSGDLAYYGAGGAATTSGTSSDFVLRANQGEMLFATNGNNERMRIDADGNVGIGTDDPASLYRLSLTGNGSNIVGGLVLSSNNNTAYLGAVGATLADYEFWNSANGYIRFGTNSQERMRIEASGNVTINGSLSKGSGSFKINHPIKPETHYLVHSFIEGPQADNIYRGKVALVDGKATVNLDEAGRMTEGTFVALNGNVQCFTTNEDGWTAVRGKVDGNILTIEAQDATCTDTASWLVIGERHDQHMIEANWTDDQGRIITEPEKGLA